MLKSSEDQDDVIAALERLESRFGVEKAAALMDAWQDHWFTAKDLDLIRSWGFNLVRVPFSYRTLQDARGDWKRIPDGAIDFSRMDWGVREAGARGIYVIFDLHVWPRQLEKGQYDLPSRWSDDGKVVREQMRKLWSEVARHYKGNGTVAGFGVINEPEGSPWNAPHRAFHDAIREQDLGPMVIVEWSGYDNTPKELPMNMVYSDHDAFKDVDSLEKYRGALGEHADVKVSLFLGGGLTARYVRGILQAGESRPHAQEPDANLARHRRRHDPDGMPRPRGGGRDDGCGWPVRPAAAGRIVHLVRRDP